MSTAPLTAVIVVTLVVGLFAAAGVTLYRRQLAAASLIAAAGFGVIHLGFVSMAWEAAATSEALPGIASLPTGIYDAPAWAAVAFLAIGVVLSVLQWRRERIMKKQLKELLEYCFFGHNEAKED